MARRSGMYKSEKRRKELKRKKKQEEKRLMRQRTLKNPFQDNQIPESMNTQPGPSEDAANPTNDTGKTDTASQ